MSFFWIILVFALFVILLVILYRAIMVRPRSADERAEAPDQIHRE